MPYQTIAVHSVFEDVEPPTHIASDRGSFQGPPKKKGRVELRDTVDGLKAVPVHDVTPDEFRDAIRAFALDGFDPGRIQLAKP